MCGIVGGVSHKSVNNFLLNGLEKLEYRGYDSAGIAYQNKNHLFVVKALGNVSRLKEKAQNLDDFFVGIGHTRWATNGKVCLKNAHPHISMDKKFALVHNGIIENAAKLKEKLLAKGVKFYGQTDSEVIVNLIALESGSTLERLFKATKKLKGSYSIALICSDDCGKIFLAKNFSPIYFCKNNLGSFLSSDPAAFADFSGEYFSLEDGQFAVLEKSQIAVYDSFLKKITPKSHQIYSFENQNLNGFKHYMIKEIFETKDSAKRLIKNLIKLNDINKNFIKNFNKIYLIGCGSAYHAALIGEKYFEKILKVEARAFIASEFRYSDKKLSKNALYIFISQSGETADVLASLKKVKKLGYKTLALCNVRYSTLAKNCEYFVDIFAGKEVSVASTKAYSLMVISLYLLAGYFAVNRGICSDFNKFVKNIKSICGVLDYINIAQISCFAGEVLNAENIFFIGRDIDFFTAKEASLKLKEVSYKKTEAYPAGELKHGYIALIDKNSLTICFLTQRRLLKKSLIAVSEILSRGGKVKIFTPFRTPKDFQKYVFHLPIGYQNKELIYPLISGVYAQLLAYFVSVKLGLNPDQPKNLAKSVTVE